MLSGQGKTLKNILLSSSSTFKTPTFSHQNTPYLYSQVQTYVQVYMKWKKDQYYDSIESIHKSIKLKPIIALKNIMVSSSPHDDYSIPISLVSTKTIALGLGRGRKNRVTSLMRQYPSFFEEFVGPKYNLPWFRLTQKAIDLHNEEQLVYQESKFDLINRLKKVILMSSGYEKKLPIKIIKLLQWNLGLPDEFLNQPEKSLEGFFRLVDSEDGSKSLAIESNGKEEAVISVMQANCMNKGVYSGGKFESIAFPLFPGRRRKLKRKIADWLKELQLLPYVSPYDDVSLLRSDSDLAEKRVVGVIHELLSLFVEQAAERKKFCFLKKYLGLPQKIQKAFERHPQMFYLSLKNRTCTAILKEAYQFASEKDTHPLAGVRKKYIQLMKDSKYMKKSRRAKKRSTKSSVDVNVSNLDCTEDEINGCSESSVDINVRDLDCTDDETLEVDEMGGRET